MQLLRSMRADAQPQKTSGAKSHAGNTVAATLAQSLFLRRNTLLFKFTHTFIGRLKSLRCGYESYIAWGYL